MNRSLFGDNDFAAMLEKGGIGAPLPFAPTAEIPDSEPVPRAIKLISIGIALGMLVPVFVPSFLLISTIGFIAMIIGAAIIPHMDRWMKTFLGLSAVHGAWRVAMLILSYINVGSFYSSIVFTLLSILFSLVGVVQLYYLAIGVFAHHGISWLEAIGLPTLYLIMSAIGYIPLGTLIFVIQLILAAGILFLLYRIFLAAE